MFTRQKGVRPHLYQWEHQEVRQLVQALPRKHLEIPESESLVSWEKKKKEKKRSETRIVTTLCKLRTPNADVVCDIDTMKGDSGEENCDVLPVVWQRKHLQSGTCGWVGGGHHSGPGHTNHCLKNPLTEQYLHEAGAWQHSVHTDNIQIFYKLYWT